jgi:predicted transcriptional regulator of viral defense system
MNRLTRSILEQNLPPVFTQEAVKSLEPDDNVRYCQMRRAIASGAIIRIKRGYYTLNKIFRKELVNQYVLAQKFVPKSYISFETALRNAGWIPEFVRAIKSATLDRKRVIDTPYGPFYYKNVPQRKLYAGTVRKLYNSDYYQEAKPLKALADCIYVSMYEWITLDPLVNSLRIETDDLETLTADDFDELEGNYESALVDRFLSGIRKELRV